MVLTATIRPPRARRALSILGRRGREPGPSARITWLPISSASYWAEGADADVQGEVNPADSPCGQLLEDRLAETRTRRGRSDRARTQGEDGLIPRPVPAASLPLRI